MAATIPRYRCAVAPSVGRGRCKSHTHSHPRTYGRGFHPGYELTSQKQSRETRRDSPQERQQKTCYAGHFSSFVCAEEAPFMDTIAAAAEPMEWDDVAPDQHKRTQHRQRRRTHHNTADENLIGGGTRKSASTATAHRSRRHKQWVTPQPFPLEGIPPHVRKHKFWLIGTRAEQEVVDLPDALPRPFNAYRNHGPFYGRPPSIFVCRRYISNVVRWKNSPALGASYGHEKRYRMQESAVI